MPSCPPGDQLMQSCHAVLLAAMQTLRVRRIYDSARQALVYIAYSTRLSTAAVSAACRACLPAVCYRHPLPLGPAGHSAVPCCAAQLI